MRYDLLELQKQAHVAKINPAVLLLQDQEKKIARELKCDPLTVRYALEHGTLENLKMRCRA